jgi:hypothetical protein
MNPADLAKLKSHLAPVWTMIRQLFKEHNFLTIVCAFLIVMMVISFYRFLKSVSPALVPIFLLLVIFVLMLHWTQTRSEPALLKPAVDWLVRVLPAPLGHPPPDHIARHT